MSFRFAGIYTATWLFAAWLALSVPIFLVTASGQERPSSFAETPSAFGDDQGFAEAPADAEAPTDPPSPDNAEGLTNVAQRAAIPMQSLLAVLREGGVLMIPIGVCSFILCVFVFERAISLRRGRVIPRPFVKRFLEQLREGEIDRDDALALCLNNRSPVSEVFAAASRRWGRPAVEVEQAIIDSGERVTNNLRSYLRLFNGIATITPLLGLLGTVLGMIRAFNAIATVDAMGRPELLAQGISQALLTTAAGLSVAIPAFIAYLYFVSRVDRLTIDIDALGQEVVACVSAEALADTGKEGAKKRRSGTKAA